MAYELVTPAAQAAIIDLLEVDSALGALITDKPTARGGGPAIYEEGNVYDGQTMPYITIGPWTQVEDHEFSPNGDGFGWNCTVQIKAISQTFGRPEQVMNAVMGVLEDGLRLTIAGYPSSFIRGANVQPLIKEILAGKTTLHQPVIFRVYVCH